MPNVKHAVMSEMERTMYRGMIRALVEYFKLTVEQLHEIFISMRVGKHQGSMETCSDLVCVQCRKITADAHELLGD